MIYIYDFYIYDIYDLNKWLDSRPINYMQMVSKHNYYVIDSYLSINMLLRILKLHSSLLCICFLRPSHFKTWSCMACVQVIHLFYSCRSSGHLRKNRQVQASPWNSLRWSLLSTMTTIWLICATFFQWLSLADLHVSLMACDFIMNFSLQAIQCDMLQELSGQLNHLSHCFYCTIVMYVMFCNDKYTGFSHVHVGSMCFLTMKHILWGWLKQDLVEVCYECRLWVLTICLNIYCAACSCTCCLSDTGFHGI